MTGLDKRTAEYAKDLVRWLRPHLMPECQLDNCKEPYERSLAAIREAEARGMEEAADIAVDYGSDSAGLSVAKFQKKYGSHSLIEAIRAAAERRRAGK